MTPQQAYQQAIDSGTILPNPDQQKVITLLDDIYRDLISKQKKTTSKFNALISTLKSPKPIKGLYLWGNVGVGKTFLMDLFYKSLPPGIKKMRLHFHEFMRMVHQQLKIFQGKKEPLKLIANNLSKKTTVICFDEFFVSDIADAMLLGKLLNALFYRGITLITSSNVPPDDLYKEGLQRQRFLPAIELIKKYTRVIHLYSSHDYRLRHLQQAGVYYTPLNDDSLHHMNKIFQHLTENYSISSDPIDLLGREITIIKQAGNVIWFDFLTICGVPRSQNDFLALAKNYRTIFISNLRVIKAQEESLITSFINLIDVLYDARVRVVISAEKPIEAIYTQGNLLFEFRRTRSRIIEMQSEDYFYPGTKSDALTTL